MFDPSQKNIENRYFDPLSDPSSIATRANYAYSYVLDVTKQQAFLEQVVNHGGKINGFDYLAKPDQRMNSYVYSK